jgi:RNA polymerase sigma-70 factor (ECF subfamily)
MGNGSELGSGDGPAALAALLARVAEQRDRAAFAELFRHFAPRIKAYVMRLGADRASAEDLVQEVMLTVWHRAGQFDRDKASLSTWIFTIARNRRIDVLRRERRPEIDAEDPALVREPDATADGLAETAQQYRLLHKAVASLPPEQVELLRVAYFEDQSHSRVAERLGLPLGTVKSRLRLALAKLRPLLKGSE